MSALRLSMALPAIALATLWLSLPARAATHTVTMEGMKFVPETVTVKRGDRVVWRNQDVVPHTATAPGKFDSGPIAAGKSWGRALTKTGRHDYVCTSHPGMKATVVVK